MKFSHTCSSFLLVFFSLLSSSTAAQDLASQIPDLGQPENRYFSANLQNLYGRLIYSEYYDSSLFVDDPIVDEYINNLGFTLFAHVTDARHIPRFFVVRNNTINAFAYPGGTIGFHTELITQTQTESELAGVMAHELSHVSQNHIARSIQNSAQQAPLQILATLVTVLAASTGGSNNGDAIMGSLAVTQGLFAQQSINFTRSQEAEADRVGIQLMEKGGYSVSGFRDFFNRLQKNYSDEKAVKIPEILRSHPLPSTRMADASARMTDENTSKVVNSLSYEMARAILFEQLESELRPNIDSLDYSPAGKSFHLALRAYANKPQDGIQQMRALSDKSFDANIHLKLAEMQLKNHQPDESMHTVNSALRLFPENVLLNLFKIERLLESGAYDSALVYLNKINERSNSPRIPKLLAQAYEKKKNLPEAYYHLGRHYYAVGNYYQALYQLDNAKAFPDLNDEQRNRIKQEYQKIYHELPDDLRNEIIKANRRR